jgi:hypothetical protein
LSRRSFAYQAVRPLCNGAEAFAAALKEVFAQGAGGGNKRGAEILDDQYVGLSLSNKQSAGALNLI